MTSSKNDHRSGWVEVKDKELSGYETTEAMDQVVRTSEVRNVLTMEEIKHLAVEGGQSAETLMNVVALIAKRFRTDVCSALSLIHI